MVENKAGTQYISDQDLSIFVMDFEKKHYSKFHPDEVKLISLIPENKRTIGVVNFILHTLATSALGAKRGRRAETLSELAEDVHHAYDQVSGPTIGMIVADIRDNRKYPECELPVSLKRFRGYSDQVWTEVVNKGLEYGFFQINEDGDTVGFSPQVEELFFPQKSS